MTLSDFGKRIKQYRLERGWTAKELGKQVGLSHASIYRLEDGTQNISVQLLFTLAEVFAIQPGDLINDDGLDIMSEPLTPNMQQLLTAVRQMNETAIQHLTAFVVSVKET
jgi:transcriptional regulator with XRE-family HTH domain